MYDLQNIFAYSPSYSLKLLLFIWNKSVATNWTTEMVNFDVLLTVLLSIILATDQLNAQILVL